MLMKRTTDNFPTIFNNNRNRSTLRFSDMLDEMMEDALSWSKGTFVPELNVYENTKKFELTLALPGMRKEDIEIS